MTAAISVKGQNVFTVLPMPDILTWPPGPAQERKGKWERCSGADSGQTFNTFAGRTRAEITKPHTQGIGDIQNEIDLLLRDYRHLSVY